MLEEVLSIVTKGNIANDAMQECFAIMEAADADLTPADVEVINKKMKSGQVVDTDLLLTNAVATLMSAEPLMTSSVVRGYFVSAGVDAGVVDVAITTAFSEETPNCT